MNKRSHEAMSAPRHKKTSRQDLDLPKNTRPPFNEVPKFVSYTSPAPSSAFTINGGPLTATTLPLNLIALIVSYLDDVGDLARVTRTSRLLYYMTLPQLYRKVHLHSYPEIRYINGKPEGFGSGSPFMLALNGLATKGHAALVQEFRLHGLWKEIGVEDFAKGVSEGGHHPYSTKALGNFPLCFQIGILQRPWPWRSRVYGTDAYTGDLRLSYHLSHC